MNDLEALSERIDAVMGHETPLRPQGGRAYSSAAREFFGKIKALRGRGFSFIQICGAFEKAGALPRNSNPYSFRQAFLRELSRRDRAKELLREVKDGGEGGNGTSAAAPSEETAPTRADAPGGLEGEGGAATGGGGKERIRRITDSLAGNGHEEIVKHTDGTFEYD